MRKYMLWAPVLLFAFAVAAPPAAAQGKAKGHAKHGQTAKKAKPPGNDRADDRDRDRREDRAIGTTGPMIRYQGLDTNHDGRIERSEWRGDDAGFNNRDWNRDGVLSGDEVRPGARRPSRPPAPKPGGGEPDEVLFARLDTNHDGALTRAEWRSTDAEFNRLDFNHDGVISPYEFGVGR